MDEGKTSNYIRYAATLLVFVLGIFGIAIDEDTASMIVIGVALVALCAYGLWKNHNLTAAARLGQRIIDLIKSGVLQPEMVEELINAAVNDEYVGKH